MISPRKGRKTASRNSALMLTRPVPWPMSPSVAESRSQSATQRPTPGTILLLYLLLMASLMACAEGLPKSCGLIWIRSWIVLWGVLARDGEVGRKAVMHDVNVGADIDYMSVAKQS